MYPEFRTIAVFLLMILSLCPILSKAQTTTAAVPFSQEEIDQMVAPIALYPDELLAQILIASTYPLEVVTAAHWVKANPNLKGKKLEDALLQQPWDPSIKALIPMPQVLDMLNEKVDITQRLGDAFLAQQKDVMDGIQRLRRKAQAQGNLQSTNEQTVTTVQQGGTSVIEIAPTNPETIYIPSYDPNVIYGEWPYSYYPPYEYYPPYYSGYYYGGGYLTYGLGYTLGYALWAHMNWYNDDIDINVNRYNEFNRSNITDNKWKHNTEHRKGVQYRDNATLQKYQGDQFKNMQARQDFRGRPGQEPKWFERVDVNTPSSNIARVEKGENINRGNELINQGGQRVNRGDQQAQRAQNLANQQSLAQQKQQFQKQWQAEQHQITQKAQQEIVAKQQQQQQLQEQRVQEQRQQRQQQLQQQRAQQQQRDAQQLRQRQQQRASSDARQINRPSNIQRPTAFDGIDQGAQMRNFSDRGAASRQSVAGVGRGGFSGGGARRGGGGRR